MNVVILFGGSILSFVTAMFVWFLFRRDDSKKTDRTQLILMPIELAMVLLILLGGNAISFLVASII